MPYYLLDTIYSQLQSVTAQKEAALTSAYSGFFPVWHPLQSGAHT